MLRIIIIFIVLYFDLFFLFGQNIEDKKDLHNYVIINRTVKDKLSSNSIRKISKINEGYIFLATYNGISLYDGESFINFTVENSPDLLSNSIYDFCYSQDSTIWLATQKGVAIFKNLKVKRLKELAPLESMSVQKIVCDKNGSIWIGTQSHGLFVFENNKLSKIKNLAELDKNIMSVLYADPIGRIWVGTEIGDLYFFDSQKRDIHLVTIPKIANGVFSALYDSKGNYYFGTRNGVYTYKKDSFILLNSNINFINDIVEDKKGNIWFATNSGLFQYDTINNTFYNFIKKQPIKKQIVQSVYFDDDDIVWISTYRKGFIQIRPSAFANYPFAQYGIDEVPAVAKLYKGALYVGTDEGSLYRFENDTIRKIKLSALIDGGRIKDIYEDKDGSLWVCSYGGLIHIQNGKETVLGGTKDFPDLTIRYITQDNKGNYYVATRQTGVYKLSKNYQVIQRFNTSNGLTSNYILSLKYHNDTLYVSTKGGIDIIAKGRIIKQYTDKTGLPDNLVFDLYIDKNILWAATIRGLSRIENDTIFTFNKTNGLKLNKIFSIAEDQFGYLWLPTVKGLMRVKKSSLNNFVKQGKEVNIRCALYDESDGIYDAEYVGATHLTKVKDGSIYFNTISGVSKLIPAVLKEQHSSPKLLINKLTTKIDTFYNEKNLVLPPSTQYINISYSYIDFVNSGKVQFRHKLIPFENNWVKSNEKTIKYTNLPPGDYSFIVEALPEIGKSKISLAYINFSIKPNFYQTVWFKVLLILIFLLIIYTIYWLRMKAVKKYQQNLEEEIKERTKELRQKNKEIAKQNEEILLHQYQTEQAYINLKMLSELGREITTHLNPSEINTVVYQNLSGIMEVSIFGIGIYIHETKEIVFDSCFFKGKIKEKVTVPLDAEKYLLARSFKNQEEIIIKDAQSEIDPKLVVFPESNYISAISSIIILPVKAKEKTIGVVTVQSYRKNAYSDYHINMLKSISVYLGVAYENAKIYDEINKQKEELQKVNTAKDKLLSIIGHDLRSPVGTIKSFLDVLLENPDMTDMNQIRDILRSMRESLGSAYNLLDNLLLWAHSQKGKVDFKQILFPVTEPIDESFSLVGSMAKNKNITLKKNIKYAGKVFADKLMVTTVLRNLITNAIKFTPRNGEIVVSTDLVELPEKYNTLFAEISVSDTGIGISQEVIDRILKNDDTFSTLGTDKEKGSGLGINICIDFLSKHDQKLIIENNKEGGSTFKFYLPINK